MLKTESFFDLSNFTHRELFSGSEFVWDGLKALKKYIAAWDFGTIDKIQYGVPLPGALVMHENKFYKGDDFEIIFEDATKGKLKVFENGRELPGAAVIMAGAVLIGTEISIAPGVLIESGAYVKGPVIIGENAEIRQGAYLRGNCIIGKRCVVGHVTEVKHSVMLDDAKAGHFAYLGDTILGNDVNLGAGTKMANLRLVGGEVQVRTENGTIATGLRKLGAILGDHVQTGCNSVTNPGTLLGKKSFVLPNVTVPSGYHRNNSLIRS